MAKKLAEDEVSDQAQNILGFEDKKGVRSGVDQLTTIDKEHVYELTAKINNCLHSDFGIKNLYHRMIFTACALVAKWYNALMTKGMDFAELHNAILDCLNRELMRDKKQNQEISPLAEILSEIRMNLKVDT